MDVNGVLVDDGGTGVVVVWRMSEARGRNILYTARGLMEEVVLRLAYLVHEVGA